MSDNEVLQGLTCPRCGGVITIPEGQAIVVCPYCDLRSVVRGDHGLRHYQVPCRINRELAAQAYKKFLSGNFAIARDAASKAELNEAFLVYLPFWAAWARAMGWAFGEESVGSGDRRHYEPREVRAVEELSWNGAACDVGEFGVNQVPLVDQQMEAFQAEALHNSGMVFEPVSSVDQAASSADLSFQERVRAKTHLDRLNQLFTRTVRRRFGVVYYPLWVIRYLYRGRAFQVAVDGNSGKVLYGKAPGNTLYRAAVLVGGMALGAFLAIDVPALIFSGSSDNSFGGAVIAFLVGLGLMYISYRAFRFGEQYELRTGTKPFNLDQAMQSMGPIGDIIKLVGR